MKGMPDKVKIAAFDVTITLWDHHTASDAQRFGEFSQLTQDIRIDGSIRKIKFIDTLIHEISHAIYWAYGINDEDKEERIVRTFATAWTQIYRDNPKLLKFIGDMLK